MLEYLRKIYAFNFGSKNVFYDKNKAKHKFNEYATQYKRLTLVLLSLSSFHHHEVHQH